MDSSAPTTGPRRTEQQTPGYHSIEPRGIGRSLLNDSGSEEQGALSSLTPNAFSASLSHNDPHSVSNTQLRRKEGRPLHGKPTIKIYQSNANLMRKLAPRGPEDETLRSVEHAPNAYSTFGREEKMHPQQPRPLKHGGSMPALLKGQSSFASVGTTQRKETTPEEGKVDAEDIPVTSEAINLPTYTPG